jgi:hypothetical protein
MRKTRPQNPSPLAGEDGRERSEWPGEGPREPVSLRIAAPPGRSPVARTLRARAATSPARGADQERVSSKA